MDVTGSLLQYGAVGIMALLGLYIANRTDKRAQAAQALLVENLQEQASAARAAVDVAQTAASQQAAGATALASAIREMADAVVRLREDFTRHDTRAR